MGSQGYIFMKRMLFSFILLTGLAVAGCGGVEYRPCPNCGEEFRTEPEESVCPECR